MLSRRNFIIAGGSSLVLKGCVLDPSGDTVAGGAGAAVGVVLADAAGATEAGKILAGLVGVAAGQGINRATTGGCVTAGTTAPLFRGALIFQRIDGRQIIQCPVNRATNKAIQEYQNNPNYIPVFATQQRQQRRRGVGNGGPFSPVFGFAQTEHPMYYISKKDLETVIAQETDTIKALATLHGISREDVKTIVRNSPQLLFYSADVPTHKPR